MKNLTAFWDRVPIPIQIAILIVVSPIALILSVIVFLALIFAAFLIFVAIHNLISPPPVPPDPIGSIGTSHCVAYGNSASFRTYYVYAKLVYDSVDFTDNPYFEPVTEDDMRFVQTFTRDWYRFLERTCTSEDKSERKSDAYKGLLEIYEQYDFFPDCVTSSDYIYFLTHKGWKEEFYYFDSETMSLYYIRWE